MEGLVKGDVVILLFPFSDLSSSRKRPAVVVAKLSGDDLILAQITSSVVRSDEYAVVLEAPDFKQGQLPISSLIKPNKLFTADKSIIFSKVGSLHEEKIKEVQDLLVHIMTK